MSDERRWSQASWTGGMLPPPPPPRDRDGAVVPRRRRTVPRVVALLASIVAVAVLVATGLGLVFSTPSGSPAAVSSGSIRPVPQASGGRADGGLDVRAVSTRVAPAIVDINTTLTSFSNPGVVGRAAGTGIILTSSGEVMTNNHVIKDASTIRVTVGSSSSYDARVVGVDQSADVALLQLRGASNLPIATLADSSSLSLGQEVVAMGNALGRGGPPSVTAGTITALGQSIVARSDVGPGEHLQGLIRTSASISPGDSGGALVNASGQVIGMITAGANLHASSSTNVGFAIPTDDALHVVDQVRTGNGGPSVVIGPAGYLGIEAAPLDPATASRLGVNQQNGVVVSGLLPGGPAEQAGIGTGSVITAVNGNTISSEAELSTLLHRHAPGEQVQVAWIDATGSHTATVTLTTGPAV